MRQVLAIALLIVATAGLAYTSHAQFMGTDPLILTVTPNYPRPFQSVTIVPESSLINLSASTVRATVNGTVVSEGSGAEPIYATMGGPGTTTTVTVTAVYNGQSYTKTLSLRPADVALVVEPISTSHPFYDGGTLIASEGRVRLVAIPDLRNAAGAVIPAENLVYTWRNGDQILQASSGIGKSVLTATSPVKYRDARVSVTVSSQDQSVVAEAIAIIAPADPIVRVYRNDPLLGPLYGTALPRAIALAGTEESFRAVPYYFSTVPSMAWTVNNVLSDTDADITVRATGSGAGTALLGVSATLSSGFQSAGALLTVGFGNDTGSTFFGL